MHEGSRKMENAIRTKSPRASWPVMWIAGRCVDKLIFIAIGLPLPTFSEVKNKGNDNCMTNANEIIIVTFLRNPPLPTLSPLGK
jgi:hypothetical protein